LCISLVIYNIP
jgi:hypothetical protein